MTAPTLPETLDDVIVRVIQRLVDVGQADYPHANGSGLTEILLGERYLGEEGGANRIIFVQTEDGGSVGGPLAVSAGQVMGITETVRCYVWGAETAADADRHRAAKQLAMRLVNAFEASAPGRLKGVRLVRGKASNIVTFGEEYQLSLAFSWPVYRDADIWAAAYAAAPTPGPTTSPPDPDRLDGGSGISFAVGTVTLANGRPS